MTLWPWPKSKNSFPDLLPPDAYFFHKHILLKVVVCSLKLQNTRMLDRIWYVVSWTHISEVRESPSISVTLTPSRHVIEVTGRNSCQSVMDVLPDVCHIPTASQWDHFLFYLDFSNLYKFERLLTSSGYDKESFSKFCHISWGVNSSIGWCGTNGTFLWR